MKKISFLVILMGLMTLSSCINSHRADTSSHIISSEGTGNVQVVSSSTPITSNFEFSSPVSVIQSSLDNKASTVGNQVTSSKVVLPTLSRPNLPGPSVNPTSSTTTQSGIKYFGNLSSADQAAYTKDREALDKKFVDEVNLLIGLYDIKSAELNKIPVPNQARIAALPNEIAQLDLQRRNAVAEATAQTGGQMNTYAQTINNQYLAQIAQKQSELDSLNQAVQKRGDLINYLNQIQAQIELLEPNYNRDIKALNDKYGIAG